MVNSGLRGLIKPLDNRAIVFKICLLEVVSRYRDTQQVTEKCRLFVKFKSQYIYQCFKNEGIFYCEQVVIRERDTCANKNTECILQSTSVLRVKATQSG